MSPALQVIYDLRYAADRFTGIGTHAHNLLQALLEMPLDDHYTVIWHDASRATRFDLEPIRRHPRVKWCPIDIPPFTWRTRPETGAWLRAHAGDVYFSPFWLAPSHAAMPTVLTLHDVRPLRPVGGEPWWKRTIFRYAVDRGASADAILTSSAFSREEILSCTSLTREQVHVVPLGIDVPRAPAMSRPAALPQGAFALVVGVNRPHKNHRVLALAWSEMGARAPLALVAAGPIDPRYPTLNELGPGLSGVHVLGQVSESELEWLYRHATLVLFPTHYEGYGLPVIEAAVRGAPVLCSDIPVLREVAGNFARWANADDVSAWMREVMVLAADPGARAQMSAAGLAAAAPLSYKHIAEQVREHLVRAARRSV